MERLRAGDPIVDAYHEPYARAYRFGYDDAMKGRVCEPVVTWDDETKQAYKTGYEFGRLNRLRDRTRA